MGGGAINKKRGGGLGVWVCSRYEGRNVRCLLMMYSILF